MYITYFFYLYFPLLLSRVQFLTTYPWLHHICILTCILCAWRFYKELCKYSLTYSLSICLCGKSDTQEGSLHYSRRTNVPFRFGQGCHAPLPISGSFFQMGDLRWLERNHGQWHCYAIAQPFFREVMLEAFMLYSHLHTGSMTSIMSVAVASMRRICLPALWHRPQCWGHPHEGGWGKILSTGFTSDTASKLMMYCSPGIVHWSDVRGSYNTSGEWKSITASVLLLTRLLLVLAFKLSDTSV